MPEFDSTISYREIPNFPAYVVGSDGSVWSRFPNASCKKYGWGPWKELKPFLSHNGYLRVRLYAPNGSSHQYNVHRLVLLAFIGPIPQDMEVCHFPDKSVANCRLDNLRYDTRRGNHADKKQHGTTQEGEKNNQAKLTSAIVIEMRQRIAVGEKIPALAKEFGVSYWAARNAIRGKRWNHV